MQVESLAAVRAPVPWVVVLRRGAETQDGTSDRRQERVGPWQQTLIGCRVSDGKVTVQKWVELVMSTRSTVALLVFGP